MLRACLRYRSIALSMRQPNAVDGGNLPSNNELFLCVFLPNVGISFCTSSFFSERS